MIVWVTVITSLISFLGSFYLIQTMKREFGEKQASITDAGFSAKYRVSGFCNAVEYEVCSEPIDEKIYYCLACYPLHGAPMQ